MKYFSGYYHSVNNPMSSDLSLSDGEETGTEPSSSTSVMPSFVGDSNMTVVYTYTGGTAHIECKVKMLGYGSLQI